MWELFDIFKVLFFLTPGREGNQPEIPLTDRVAQQLAAYPRVTYREETHSTLEFRLRPVLDQKTPPPARQHETGPFPPTAWR